MYQGNNPTALASQKLMLDTLNELLKTKEFKDISVSELCTKSGVSRQTFYSLFGSKENILLYQLDLINNTKPAQDETDILDLTEICNRYSKYVVSNYEQLKTLMENNLADVLNQMFYNTMSSCGQGFVDLNQSEVEYASRFMAAGLCALTQKYIKEHKKPSQNELTELSYKILSGRIYKN